MRIAVDGNIGSGKSTALALLDVPEPGQAWRDLLEKFYADPVEYALPVALRALLSFLDAAEAGGAVFERHPGTTRHVFAQLQYNRGELSDAAFDTFKQYYDVLDPWTPDVVVYLDVPPEDCMKNIQQRDRGITLDYLKAIEFQYKNYLKHAPCRVIFASSPEEAAGMVKDLIN